MEKISIKWLVLGVIASFSILTIITALLTSSIYREEAFDSNREISSRFIEVTTNDAIGRLKGLTNELSVELQSDKSVRKLFSKALKSDEKSKELAVKLNESFNRRFQTAGLLNIKKIRTYDTDFKLISESEQGAKIEGELPSLFKKILMERSGTKRLQQIDYFWSGTDETLYSLVKRIW